MTRNRSIDALRGLAVALVALGHALLAAHAAFADGAGLVIAGAAIWIPEWAAANPLLSFVYSFHMPLFAFVAGLVLKPYGRSLVSQVARRARSLLVPYVLWFILLYPLALVVQPRWVGGFWAAVRYAVVGVGVLWWALWYLYALFVCLAVVLVVSRLPAHRSVLALTALASVIAATEVIVKIPVQALYLSSVVWIYPFLVLGYLVAPYEAWVREHRLTVVAFSSICFGTLLWLRHPIYMIEYQPLTRILTTLAGSRYSFAHHLVPWVAHVTPYACAVSGIIALWALYVGRSGRLIDLQAWLGKRSLGIYATHFAVQWVLVTLGVTSPALLLVLSLAAASGMAVVIERMAWLRGPLLGTWGDSAPRSRSIDGPTSGIA